MEKGNDLSVIDLLEALVVQPDGVKGLRLGKADHFVGILAEGHTRLPGPDGYCHNQAPGCALSEGSGGRPHGGSRGKPVVHQQDGSAFDRGRRAPPAETPLPAPCLIPLFPGNLVEVRIVYPELADDFIVQEPLAIGCYRSEGKLGLEGRSEFPGYNNVQLGVKPAGDLRAHRNTPPRDGEYHRPCLPVRLQALGQLLAGVAPVLEAGLGIEKA